MERRYRILDVFTDKPLTGNPLAVVADSEGLDGDAMQAVAREFNLSETVFVGPPANPVHTASVRIFTPERELGFAGHPTVGTAVMLARRNGLGQATREGIIVLELKSGTVRVGVRLSEHGDFAEFDVPKLPERDDTPVDKELAAAALGLMPSEIGFENHRPQRWSAGNPFAFVPLRDLDVMRKCRIERRPFDEAFGEAVCVYCRQTFAHENDFHMRMFAPGLGVREDPATGSAAAAFAGVVMDFDQPTSGTHRYRLEQGHMMERPSLIELELVVAGGGLDTVRIGGGAVMLAEGTLYL